MNLERKKKNWLEWAVFSLGMLLLVGILAYLVYSLWTGPTVPPRVSVRLGEITERSGRYDVEVHVRNDGNQAAGAVEVEVELRRKEKSESEKAGFVVQFVPSGATRRGIVTFTSDPRTADQLTAVVRGYQIP